MVRGWWLVVGGQRFSYPPPTTDYRLLTTDQWYNDAHDPTPPPDAAGRRGSRLDGDPPRRPAGAGSASACWRGRELPLAGAAADRRRPPRGRGLLVPGRPTAGLSERAGAWQSLLSDLRARLCVRRHEAHLAGSRQDDVLLLPPTKRSDALCLHAPRSAVEGAAAGRARLPRVGQGAALRLGLRPGVRDLCVLGDLRATHAADQRPGLRRRGQLFAGWRVDRVLVDARCLQPDADSRRAEAARDRSQLLRRDLHHARRRLGAASSDQCRRVRRRPLLLSRRLAHHLAPVRRSRDSSPTCGR